jgi:Spy/CpxP family protein refolding chaperone
LKQGFGVMSCMRRGRFEGCYFVFPKYRIALDMGTGCVLCADVHEWHGNSPIKGNKGMFERVSLVLYYREQLKRCGTAAQELERSKKRPQSDSNAGVWDQLEADRADRVAWEQRQAEEMKKP